MCIHTSDLPSICIDGRSFCCLDRLIALAGALACFCFSRSIFRMSERVAMFFDAAKIMVCCSSFVLEGKGHTLILATSALQYT